MGLLAVALALLPSFHSLPLVALPSASLQTPRFKEHLSHLEQQALDKLQKEVRHEAEADARFAEIIAREGVSAAADQIRLDVAPVMTGLRFGAGDALEMANGDPLSVLPLRSRYWFEAMDPVYHRYPDDDLRLGYVAAFDEANIVTVPDYLRNVALDAEHEPVLYCTDAVHAHWGVGVGVTCGHMQRQVDANGLVTLQNGEAQNVATFAFVISTNGGFYGQAKATTYPMTLAHNGRTMQTQPSTFRGGQPVRCAGVATLANGVITRIYQSSGHYAPDDPASVTRLCAWFHNLQMLRATAEAIRWYRLNGHNLEHDGNWYAKCDALNVRFAAA